MRWRCSTRTLQPLAGTITTLTGTDALLNVQSDGSYYTAAGVTVSGVADNGGTVIHAPVTKATVVSGKTWSAVGPVWEGLSPAYWETPQYYSNWTAPYTTGSSFATVFGVTQESPSLTLLDALQRSGDTGLNALARAAVAALLNAASPNVNYVFATTQVIDLVKAAYANPSIVTATTNEFLSENEQGVNIALGTGGVVGGGVPYGANATALIQQNAQYVFGITAAGISSRLNRAETLGSGPSFLDAGELDLPFFRLLGDFNGDNIVNNGDFSLLNACLNTQAGMAGYDPVYDLNNDGVIDTTDVRIAQQYQGDTTDFYPPTVIGMVVPISGTSQVQVNAFKTDAVLLGLAADTSGLIQTLDEAVQFGGEKLPECRDSARQGQTPSPSVCMSRRKQKAKQTASASV